MKDKNNLEPSEYKTSISGTLCVNIKPNTLVISNNDSIKYIRYKDKEYKLDDIKNAFKALEIIRKKEVDIHNLLISKTVKQYNSFTKWLSYKENFLTKEEFNLLKEILK